MLFVSNDDTTIVQEEEETKTENECKYRQRIYFVFRYVLIVICRTIEFLEYNNDEHLTSIDI
jgi:hypothetical protein